MHTWGHTVRSQGEREAAWTSGSNFLELGVGVSFLEQLVIRSPRTF